MNDSQLMVLELGSKGYSCAQILLISTLRLLGIEDENLIRTMSALGQGGGNSGKTCGALTGGLCMLSLYTAKGSDFELALDKEALLWEELQEWFQSEFCQDGNTDCDALLNLNENNKDLQNSRLTQNPTHCAMLISKVWEKCLELLSTYNLDCLSERS